MSTEIHLSDDAKRLARKAAAEGKAAADDAASAAKEVAAAVNGAAQDGYERIAGKAQQAMAAAQSTAHNAAAAAKDVYQVAKEKVDDQLMGPREFVRRNPVPSVLGALAFGAALGYLLMPGRRSPSFAHRYLDEPFDHARVALLAALAPVASRLHEGYDLAKDGAERAIDRVQEIHPTNVINCLAQRVASLASRFIR